MTLACTRPAETPARQDDISAVAAEKPTQQDSLTTAEFATLSARLSDAGGYFDTDNLISNEPSLLHVLSDLARMHVRGGAYVGVGPDQNFNYIARIAPRIAFVMDIRRDNLLQHLLFKALFADARNRVEYLAHWLGRPAPADVSSWNARPIDSLVAWAVRTPSTRQRQSAVEAVRRRVRVRHPSSAADLTDRAVSPRVHRRGRGVAFTAMVVPRLTIPRSRNCSRADRDGAQSGYLASEDAFRVVQSLERRNLVIPVVSDLAGPKGLPTLAAVLRERGDSVSAFYTSNVEDYLIRDGRFPTFVRSLAALPRQTSAVIIRSWFGGAGSHPRSVSGYHTTQLAEPIADLVGDPSVAAVRSYRQLVMRLR